MRAGGRTGGGRAGGRTGVGGKGVRERASERDGASVALTRSFARSLGGSMASPRKNEPAHSLERARERANGVGYIIFCPPVRVPPDQTRNSIPLRIAPLGPWLWGHIATKGCDTFRIRVHLSNWQECCSIREHRHRRFVYTT